MVWSQRTSPYLHFMGGTLTGDRCLPFSFKWVWSPSHQGTPGHEQADKPAKKGDGHIPSILEVVRPSGNSTVARSADALVKARVNLLDEVELDDDC